MAHRVTQQFIEIIYGGSGGGPGPDPTVGILVDKDVAVKALTGKTGEIPCKYPEPSVDLTGAEAGDAVLVTGGWRLTQKGAKKVHIEYVRQRNQAA